MEKIAWYKAQKTPIFDHQTWKYMIDGDTFVLILDTVGFWCQTIHKKFLHIFNISFEIKMMVKIYAIEIIFKSYKPF